MTARAPNAMLPTTVSLYGCLRPGRIPLPRRFLLFALPLLLLLPGLAVAGPIYHATVGDSYYNGQWLRDVSFAGPDGTRYFQIPGLDVVTSMVAGDLGVLAISGEIAGDAIAGVVRYDGAGMERIPFRHDEVPHAYPAGYQHVPSAEPELLGWDDDGFLTGRLWAQPIGMVALSGSPYVAVPYTWDIQGNTITNPEPATVALMAAGLGVLFWRRNRLFRR